MLTVVVKSGDELRRCSLGVVLALECESDLEALA